MPPAYYSPGEVPTRFAADVKALKDGHVPDWWQRGFDEIADERGSDRSWFDFVLAYEFAGQNLVGLMSKHPSERFRVSLSPPIIFLYRHALELMLKQVEMALDHSEGRSVQVRGSHTIAGSWARIRDRVAPGLDEQDEELSLLDQAIEVVQAVDPTSFTFRYPVDRGGTPTPNTDPVDPEALARVVTHIVDVLTVAPARVLDRARHEGGVPPQGDGRS